MMAYSEIQAIKVQLWEIMDTFCGNWKLLPGLVMDIQGSAWDKSDFDKVIQSVTLSNCNSKEDLPE